MDPLDIPSFLLRKPDNTLLEPERWSWPTLVAGPTGPAAPEPGHGPTAREMQLEAQREKSRLRIEKMLAKKSGATKRPALEGKAALEAIRKGHV